MKKLKLKDTRGVEHTIVAADVEMFSPGIDPLGRPCLEVMYEGEVIFADCSLDDFTQALHYAISISFRDDMPMAGST